MSQHRLSAAAQFDIIGILVWSQEQFGDEARERYQALIVTALRDIAAQPDQPGSIERPELGAAVRTWHLSLSRERARKPTGIVRYPRHFLIYRMESDTVIVGRILHDAMELARYIDPDSSRE
jgi:toxin ParE1/3/4